MLKIGSVSIPASKYIPFLNVNLKRVNLGNTTVWVHKNTSVITWADELTGSAHNVSYTGDRLSNNCKVSCSSNGGGYGDPDSGWTANSGCTATGRINPDTQHITVTAGGSGDGGGSYTGSIYNSDGQVVRSLPRGTTYVGDINDGSYWFYTRRGDSNYDYGSHYVSSNLSVTLSPT